MDSAQGAGELLFTFSEVLPHRRVKSKDTGPRFSTQSAMPRLTLRACFIKVIGNIATSVQVSCFSTSPRQNTWCQTLNSHQNALPSLLAYPKSHTRRYVLTHGSVYQHLKTHVQLVKPLYPAINNSRVCRNTTANLASRVYYLCSQVFFLRTGCVLYRHYY